MLNINDIKLLIEKMTDDKTSNIRLLKNAFGSLQYRDSSNQTLLHILVDNLYDEEKVFLVIKSLLEIGIIPNVVDEYNYNFIQTALYAGYSEDFILKIIKESLKYNLDINHVDSDKDTIMHTVIYSDDYKDEIINIYNLLCENGFDSNKVDNDGYNLYQAIKSSKYDKTYTEEQIDSFKQLFIQRTNSMPKSEIVTKTKQTATMNDIKLSEEEIIELEKFGKILNKKNYFIPPTIGREKELTNLIISIAQDKKRPIITGESGVGKTSVVEELVYRIKNGDVPNFLQGKIVLEVNPSDVVAGCEYIGQFEMKMSNLMKLCEKYDLLVVIDEIHTIYGTGRSKNNANDMASMLKYYLDRTDLKVIGTTTENEYNQYFASDALKRRFKKIKVTEPTGDLLYQILDKVINDYCIKTGITLENEDLKDKIINIIIETTDTRHRELCNPDLSISIIDGAFAFAKTYDADYITKEHFIKGLELCDNISNFLIEQAISKVKKLEPSKEKTKEKILRVDFTKYKK